MRCDIIALGIINAARELDLKIPLVVRLQGVCNTRSRIGRRCPLSLLVPSVTAVYSSVQRVCC